MLKGIAMLRRFLSPSLAFGLLAGGLQFATATQNVTSVSSTFTPGTPSNSEGYTYENSQQTLTGFSTATSNYAISSGADNVFVRRNNTTANQSSNWYTSSGVGTNLSGTHEDSYTQMLRSNNVLSGSDNTFANTGTGGQFGNIERIDFTWNSGLTVNNSLAFAVFDRGAAGAHDGFGIAAITGIDAAGNPTAFGSLLIVASGWGGATNPIGDMNYRLFRYANGDDLTATTDSTGTATQGIGGIVLTAADLGLTNGSTVYGYALMGSDVTASNSAQLLDWLNGTYYPTTTDGNTGGGGIDLASFNGFQIVAVPEPVTLPALL
ncbi:MAG: hypothetical protein M3Y86_05185, partial [Verrucomicrobiota bacterium]|nr:hypothetical protein [Verrucomicrobiota bacterium]